MEVLHAAERHAANIAVRAGGLAIRYGDLLAASQALAAGLSKALPPRAPGAPAGPRVGIHAEPGFPYVAATWAAWMAGGVAVPLAPAHPAAEVEYVLRDAGVSAVLAPPAAASTDRLRGPAGAAGASIHEIDLGLFASAVAEADVKAGGAAGPAGGQAAAGHAAAGFSGRGGSGGDSDGALIIYTSGTTGRPKGALHTHGSLGAQIRSLVNAWGWVPTDRILHALPLHHIHGIVNAMHCAHASGACVDFMASFQPNAAWRRLRDDDISVLMAVPTMYSYMLMSYDRMPEDQQAAARAAAARLRLAISGSASAPPSIMQRWREISGQTLLERYGMTEAGMILSNPYEGERRAGYVGRPLPGVQVKLAADPSDPRGAAPAPGLTGEIRVGGPHLFAGYWGRPEATAESFDADGLFRTGDVAEVSGDPPYFKILGRASVDIIKSNAFKVSALEVEGALLQIEGVQECSVLGVPDEVHGEQIAALVMLKQGAADALAGGRGEEGVISSLRAACAEKLAKYKVPSLWQIVDEPLPRNAMGKVNKKDLWKRFETRA